MLLSSQVSDPGVRAKRFSFPYVCGAKHSLPFPSSGVPFGENSGVAENVWELRNFLNFAEAFDIDV